MINIFKRFSRKQRPMSQKELLSKFELISETFNKTEESTLTSETILLSYQSSLEARQLKTHEGIKSLSRFNWKKNIRKQEVEALTVENSNFFNSLENYFASLLMDIGMDIKRMVHSVNDQSYQIELDFKQPFRNEDFFSELSDLSRKVEEFSGNLRLYKSKDPEEALWKLVLSVDKTLRPQVSRLTKKEKEL